MSRRFAEITFTPAVQDAQTRYGSRHSYAGLENHDQTPDKVGPIEAAFIEERDGFYQASVNKDGWPYVQYRGGPAGFLKVLDDSTLGYADFRGNVQYISVGNMADNDRISLILMDYPNRRRLKIWARAELVDYKDNPELVEKLEIPTYRAEVERGVILHVEAMDWNCPQHIVPRYSEDQIKELVQPLHQKIHELEQAQTQKTPKSAETNDEAIGTGPLDLIVTGVRQLTPEIRNYEFKRVDHSDFPEFAAGSNVEIPVRLPTGEIITRFYSISSNPKRRDLIDIAVKIENEGRGGSLAIHNSYQIGTRIKAKLVNNRFQLHNDVRPAVLIAGGIGITPLKAMAHELWDNSREFHLHYAVRSLHDAAYCAGLREAFREHVSFYASDQHQHLNIDTLLKDSPANAVFYICGPQRLIDGVLASADTLGIERDRIRYETFSANEPQVDDQPIEVHLRKSDRIITVASDQTILDAVLEEGITAPHGCKTGGCGTCATKVVEGIADHRDTALSDDERNQAGLMCPCVSRAVGNAITLDL